MGSNICPDPNCFRSSPCWWHENGERKYTKADLDAAVAKAVAEELLGVIAFASGESKAQVVEDYATDRLNAIRARGAKTGHE